MPQTSTISNKYEQVERKIWRRVNRGTYRRGERIPSLNELCRTMGVGRDTVRHALGNLIRDGVLVAQPGYGHVVRSTERRMTVAVWLTVPIFQLPTSQFAPLLFDALRHEFHQRDWRMSVYLPQMDVTQYVRLDPQRLPRDIGRNRFGAVIAIGWPQIGTTSLDDSLLNQQVMEQLQSHKMPFAAMSDADLPGTVKLDYESVAETGTQYFVDQGKRKIALMTSQAQSLPMVTGYQRVLANAGVAFDSARLCCPTHLTEKQAYHAFIQWWQQKPDVEAMVVGDDVLAKGAVAAAIDMGIAVPDVLALATLNIRGSQTFYPRPLVRLVCDPVLMANHVCDQLQAQIDGQPMPPAKSVKPVIALDTNLHANSRITLPAARCDE